MDHRRGAKRSVSQSGWTMRPYVGRRDMAPRLLRGHHEDRLERDRGGHVVGVRRHVGEDHRHRVLARGHSPRAVRPSPARASPGRASARPRSVRATRGRGGGRRDRGRRTRGRAATPPTLRSTAWPRRQPLRARDALQSVYGERKFWSNQPTGTTVFPPPRYSHGRARGRQGLSHPSGRHDAGPKGHGGDDPPRATSRSSYLHRCTLSRTRIATSRT